MSLFIKFINFGAKLKIWFKKFLKRNYDGPTHAHPKMAAQVTCPEPYYYQLSAEKSANMAVSIMAVRAIYNLYFYKYAVHCEFHFGCKCKQCFMFYLQTLAANQEESSLILVSF